MGTKDESQGLREATAVDGSAAAWDPYEVWLNRVKKPRDQQAAPVQTTIKVGGPELSETARVRALAASAIR